MYVILAYFGFHQIAKDSYPAIYNHLSQYEEKLKARGQCKYSRNGATNVEREYSGQHHWLELDNNPSLEKLDEFSKPKIIFQEMVQSSQFSYDAKGEYFCNDTGRIITGDHLLHLLGVFNSNLFFFAIKNYYGGGGLGSDGVRMKHTFFEKFSCIPPNKEIENLVTILLSLKSPEKLNELNSKINSVIYNLYGLTIEERLYVESKQ